MDDISRFLSEDIGKKGDITSHALFTTQKGRAIIFSKQDCLVAGLAEAQIVFKKTGASARQVVKDGAWIKKGSTVMEIKGPVCSILTAERLALNFIGRMSGIATETNRMVQQCRRINPTIQIAATRKTTPGFRVYEKKAVILGGGEPHRYGLYDAVLIKDNHLKMVGSLEEAITTIRKKIGNKPIEIEVENQSDAIIAAHQHVDVIMLDNMNVQKGRTVAKMIRSISPDILIEVSGGITGKNIEKYASFADRISLGCLTHSVESKDFSLEIFKN